MLWYVVFVALFVTVPVSAVPNDSSNVVRAASTDTSTVVRRQKNPTICKYRSFNVIHFPCCTLIMQHSIHHIAQSIINNHSSLIFLRHALTSIGSSERYIQRRECATISVNDGTSLTCFLWNNQQMQLYAVNFIPLLGSLYMFRVFYTPIIRSTIYICIYSH